MFPSSSVRHVSDIFTLCVHLHSSSFEFSMCEDYSVSVSNFLRCELLFKYFCFAQNMFSALRGLNIGIVLRVRLDLLIYY